jgi:hypothetical protein
MWCEGDETGKLQVLHQSPLTKNDDKKICSLKDKKWHIFVLWGNMKTHLFPHYK